MSSVNHALRKTIQRLVMKSRKKNYLKIMRLQSMEVVMVAKKHFELNWLNTYSFLPTKNEHRINKRMNWLFLKDAAVLFIGTLNCAYTYVSFAWHPILGKEWQILLFHRELCKYISFTVLIGTKRKRRCQYIICPV